MSKTKAAMMGALRPCTRCGRMKCRIGQEHCNGCQNSLQRLAKLENPMMTAKVDTLGSVTVNLPKPEYKPPGFANCMYCHPGTGATGVCPYCADEWSEQDRALAEEKRVYGTLPHKMQRDLDIYGTAAVRLGADGKLERIDPTKLVIHETGPCGEKVERRPLEFYEESGELTPEMIKKALESMRSNVGHVISTPARPASVFDKCQACEDVKDQGERDYCDMHDPTKFHGLNSWSIEKDWRYVAEKPKVDNLSPFIEAMRREFQSVTERYCPPQRPKCECGAKGDETHMFFCDMHPSKRK